MRETYFAALPCCSESVFLLTSERCPLCWTGSSGLQAASDPRLPHPEADNVSLRLEPPRHPRAVDHECDSDRQHRC
jgi:hypothetical protein